MSSTNNTDNNTDRSRQSDFVADGDYRLEEGIRSEVLPGIQAAVMDEYSGRLSAAGFLRKIWLRWCIKTEIEQRLKMKIANVMPSDETLY